MQQVTSGSNERKSPVQGGPELKKLPKIQLCDCQHSAGQPSPVHHHSCGPARWRARGAPMAL
eukprot:2418939-Alexandrium_andersonii.AAC.1